MHDSPNNDAEQKLRSYAEARRKQAQGNWEPHPASLRELQAEARRVWGQAKPPRRIFFSFGAWLPWTAAVASVLLLGWVWQLNRRKSSYELAANRQTATASPQEVLERQSRDMPDDKYKRATPKTPANSESQFGLNGAVTAPVEEPLGTVALGITAAPQSPPGGAPGQIAPTPADQSVAQNNAFFAESSRKLGRGLVTREPLSNAGVADLDSSIAGAGEARSYGLRFQRDRSASAKTGLVDSLGKPRLSPPSTSAGGVLASGSRSKLDATAPPSAALPALQSAKDRAPDFQVMDSFEVRRNGNNLTITDADGSVYQGAITAITATTAPEVASRPAGGGFGGGGFRQSLEEKETLNAPVGNATQGTPFQAIGTNISLQLPVVITGFLAGDIQESPLARSSPPVADGRALAYSAPVAPPAKKQMEAVPPAAMPLAAAKDARREAGTPAQPAAPPAPAPASKAELAKSPPPPTVIVGRVVIGKTNTVELRATSTPPGP